MPRIPTPDRTQSRLLLHTHTIQSRKGLRLSPDDERRFAHQASWPLLLILFGVLLVLSGFVFAWLSVRIKENSVQKT